MKNLDTRLRLVSKFFTLSSDYFIRILKSVLGYRAISLSVLLVQGEFEEHRRGEEKISQYFGARINLISTSKFGTNMHSVEIVVLLLN